ncbi:MAG: TlpA family protein disulfide reductase [Bacteroidetes bacterium]|nr:TlpA family protein disulfide reductase [Bacteroidota bacterium]
MDLKKLCWSILSFLFSMSVFCTNTNISGVVSNANGYTIGLKVYGDYISYLEKTVASTIINEDGTFSLDLNVTQTRLYKLVIGFQEAEIYLEPNEKYQLSINYDPTKERITFVNKTYLEVELLRGDEETLNDNIRTFNAYYNDFLSQNFNLIYRGKQRRLLDTLKSEINRRFTDNSTFVANTINYRIAILEQAAGFKNRVAIFNTYFKNKDILYGSIEYMILFNDFYKNYLQTPNKFFNSQVIQGGIHHQAGLAKVIDYLANDPFLSNQQIRELVLIKELIELYYVPGINKENILSLYNELRESTNFPVHIEIIKNIYHQLTYLKAGTKMPEINLIDLQGNIHKLEEYYGKYIFMSFFTLPCDECMRELDSLASIFPKYKSEVEFISVAYELTSEDLQLLKSNKAYKWNLMIPAKRFRLAELLRLRSLPDYILIDPNGTILAYPAIFPNRSSDASFKTYIDQ